MSFPVFYEGLALCVLCICLRRVYLQLKLPPGCISSPWHQGAVKVHDLCTQWPPMHFNAAAQAQILCLQKM